VQRTLLILLVAASYGLVAGARPWALAVLLTIAVLAVAVAPRRTLKFSSPAIDRTLIAVAAAIALQIVPLPAAIVDAISPHRARVVEALGYAPLTAARSGWQTLSIDPAMTAWALATFLLGVLAFWITRALCGAGGHTRAICRTLAIVGSAAAVLALLQKALTPRLVMFAVSPDARSGNPFGAFVNRNHMAAWLLLGMMPLAGYLIARLRIHSDSRLSFFSAFKQFLVSGAALTALALIVMLGVLLLTLSRSGLIALGVAAIVAWWSGRTRIQLERTSIPGLIGGAGVLLLVAVLFIDVDGWASRLQQSVDFGPAEFSRTQIWKESAPLAGDFWLTGAGAGTYSEAMTQYQQTRLWVNSMRRWAHFNNAHSHYVQVAVEGGVLLALPVLWALVAFTALARKIVPADKGEMFWVRVGAVAALAGVAVQSIWETSLIMPANAVMAGVAAGLALYRRDR
jgi:putative inorganic carbon (hco3(-)) transporter